MAQQKINVRHAMQMRDCGESWVQIGHILAFLIGRYQSFHGTSVMMACKRAGKIRPLRLQPSKRPLDHAHQEETMR